MSALFHINEHQWICVELAFRRERREREQILGEANRLTGPTLMEAAFAAARGASTARRTIGVAQ